MKIKIEVGHIVFLVLLILSVAVVSHAAFTTLNTTDTLSNFPTTYNNNIAKTLEVGTTSVASITTLSSLISVGTITTGTWATNLSGSFINQLGNSVIPYSISGTLATSSAKLYFDSTLGTLALASSTLSTTASTSGSLFVPNVVEASDIRATSTITLRGVKYTPPAADGSSLQILSTNGSAVMSWIGGGANMSFTAGQALNKNDPVTVEPTGSTPSNEGSATGAGNIQCGETSVSKLAQSFKPTTSKLITKMDVSLNKVGTPSVALEFDIVGDLPANSNPATGLIMASTTIPASDITGSYVTRTLSFFPAVYIPANTRFWVLCHTKDDSTSGTNYYQWAQASGDPYARGGTAYSTNGTSWTFQAANDQNVLLYDSGTTLGNVYISSAIASTSASTTVGFITSNVATSGTATVQGTANVITSIRSLIIGTDVYLGNDPRTLSATSGLYPKLVGIMVSATSFLAHILPF